MSLPPVTLIWFDVLGRTHRRDTNCGTHIKKKIRGEKYLHIRWPGRRRGRWSEWSSFWALYPVRLWRPGQVDSTTGRVTLANYLVKQTTRKHSSHVLFLPKGEFKDYFTAKWHEVGKLHLRASLFRKKKRVNYSTSQQGSTNTHRLKKKKKNKAKGGVKLDNCNTRHGHRHSRRWWANKIRIWNGACAETRLMDRHCSSSKFGCYPLRSPKVVARRTKKPSDKSLDATASSSQTHEEMSTDWMRLNCTVETRRCGFVTRRKRRLERQGLPDPPIALTTKKKTCVDLAPGPFRFPTFSVFNQVEFSYRSLAAASRISSPLHIFRAPPFPFDSPPLHPKTPLTLDLSARIYVKCCVPRGCWISWYRQRGRNRSYDSCRKDCGLARMKSWVTQVIQGHLKVYSREVGWIGFLFRETEGVANGPSTNLHPHKVNWAKKKRLCGRWAERQETRGDGRNTHFSPPGEFDIFPPSILYYPPLFFSGVVEKYRIGFLLRRKKKKKEKRSKRET